MKKFNKFSQKETIDKNNISFNQSRREFFKTVSALALPTIAFIGLGSIGKNLFASGKNYKLKNSIDCRGNCTGTCEANCAGGCANDCETTCSGNCRGSCESSCTGNCEGKMGRPVNKSNKSEETTCDCTGCTGNCMGPCKGDCMSACNECCSGGCTSQCHQSCGFINEATCGVRG